MRPAHETKAKQRRERNEREIVEEEKMNEIIQQGL